MSETAPGPLTIMFWPESAYGPTNQCIGLADLLLDRGHTIVFAAESSWAGKLAPLGFVEELVDLAEPAAGRRRGGRRRSSGPTSSPRPRRSSASRRSSSSSTFIQPTYQALIDGAKYCEPRLREIIAEAPPRRDRRGQRRALPGAGDRGRAVRADRVVQPARGAAAPTSRRRSPGCRATTAPSGRPTARSSTAPTARCGRTSTPGCGSRAPTPLPDLEFMPRDNAANLYVYPAEADYLDARPLDDSWHRIDSSVRETDEDYVVPAAVADRPEDSALIYLSLGSLGGADVELMQRLVDVLGTTRHRFIVSKGPQADRITLADNMVGAQMLPQTKVIPQVDLVITHGGNNTTTEALHFGKPMIVLPLFWDQYDNAQRVDELGFGVRLATYALRRRRADRRGRTPARRHRAARPGSPRSAPRSARRDGLRVGADVIERVGARAHRASVA